MRVFPVLVFLSAVACAQPGVKVGDPAPLPEAERIWNADFNHFDQTWGKAVVYVWFVPELQTRKFVTKLNQVHDRYHKQGCVVAAISHRDEDQMERWVKRYRPRFTVVCEPSNISMGSYPFMQWPSAVLASPRGRVMWKGSGDRVPEAKLRVALKTAITQGPAAPLRIVVDLPKAHARAQTALERGQLAKALDLLDGDTDTEKQARGLVTGLLQEKVVAARDAEKQGRFHTASRIFSRVNQHAPGTRWGEEAKKTLARYRLDLNIRRELKGGAVLVKAEEAMDERDWKKAKKLLEKLLVKEYEGTRVRARAEEMLRKLE